MKLMQPHMSYFFATNVPSKYEEGNTIKTPGLNESKSPIVPFVPTQTEASQF